MSIALEAKTVMQECLERSHAGTMSFGEVAGNLMGAGVESYLADYRRGENVYYMPTGETYAVASAQPAVQIEPEFDAEAVRAAIRGAQSGAVKYPEFVCLTRAAGCVGYFVWIAGRHVQYFGRRGEVHVEKFPGT